jgi:hypothetical protein
MYWVVRFVEFYKSSYVGDARVHVDVFPFCIFIYYAIIVVNGLSDLFLCFFDDVSRNYLKLLCIDEVK